MMGLSNFRWRAGALIKRRTVKMAVTATNIAERNGANSLMKALTFMSPLELF